MKYPVYWMVAALLVIAILAGCTRHYPPAPKYQGYILTQKE